MFRITVRVGLGQVTPRIPFPTPTGSNLGLEFGVTVGVRLRLRVRIADTINRLHRTHRIFPMQQLRQRNHLTFGVIVGLAGPHTSSSSHDIGHR